MQVDKLAYYIEKHGQDYQVWTQFSTVLEVAFFNCLLINFDTFVLVSRIICFQI